MKIRQIRNATLVIEYGGKKFLIDPWLQDKGMGATAPSPDKKKNKIPSPVVSLPCAVTEILEGVDACIITHIHPDHFTPENLPKDMLYILQNKKDEAKLNKMGFMKTKCFEQETLTFHEVTLIKTPGRHGEKKLTAKIIGNVCGIAFKHPRESTLYLVGDSIWYDEVQDVIDTRMPDFIILNACDARLKIFGRLIMNKEDVFSVCKHAPSAKIIVSHMDAVNHAFLSRKELRQYLMENRLDEQVLIPEDGEILSL